MLENSINGHLEWIACILYTPDGKQIGSEKIFSLSLIISNLFVLVSGSGDRTIRVWDVN